MQIVIVGGGAVGSAFAALLSAVAETALLVRRPEHASANNKHGITLRTEEGESNHVVNTSDDPHVLSDAELVLVLTKTYQTDSAAKLVSEFAPATSTVASLQNGIGAVDILNGICGTERVVAGSTGIAATKLDDTLVEVSHVGTAVIGEQDGSQSSRCEQATKYFCQAGFDGYASNNIWSEIWTKLGISVGQNAASALCNLTFAEMRASSEVRGVVHSLTDEFQAVATAEGVQLIYEPYERLLENWARVPDHRSSMWQDFVAGRQSEIDFMNGAIVRLGDKHNISTR